MALFSEREGLRKAREKTNKITYIEYGILLEECKRYYEFLAGRFSLYCPDHASTICDFDEDSFTKRIIFEIPMIFCEGYTKKYIAAPNKEDEFDQYALLDFIEFIAENLRDYKKGEYHGFFGHYHLNFLRTDNIFKEFQAEINAIFEKAQLLFFLTDSKKVERRIITGAVTTIAPAIALIDENGLQELLNDAIQYFKMPDPSSKPIAVEKLWDAFERLKTYYETPAIDKRRSAEKVVADMAKGNTNYLDLLNAEFKALTDIGNNYRIRHHERSKIDITEDNQFDYFFNRCIAIIEFAIKSLPR